MSQRAAWSLTGVLFALVAITLPELGSDPLHFRPPSVDPQGPLAPLGYELADWNHPTGVGVVDAHVPWQAFTGPVGPVDADQAVGELKVDRAVDAVVPQAEGAQVH